MDQDRIDRAARHPSGRPPAPAPPGFREPTFGQRVLARVVDGLVVAPAAVVVAVALHGWARPLVGIGLVAGYEVVMVARDGRTVGKVVLGTRVVDAATGRRPSWLQSTRRWSVVVVATLLALAFPELDPIAAFVLVGVLAPALAPPLHRGLHDRLARTVVTAA